MNCAECPKRKEIQDAVALVEGAPKWVCNQLHSETNDQICLLRMLIWEISALSDIIEDFIISGDDEK